MSISYDYFHCRRCRTPVARIEDYFGSVQAGGIFKRVFNVEVLDAVNNHQTPNENTIANAYCVQCEALLGGKFIAVAQPGMFVREGRFLMNLNKLMMNEEPLIYLGADEENADQDGDITDLDEDAPDQYGDTSDQDGDGIDQHGDTTEKNGDANDQCGDTTEQDGDATDQDGNANEQNADQDLNANGQNADQDLGSNEQNNDQDLGANGQNADQDGDANEQVPKEQDVGANEQNADQDGGGNEQNDDDEDGGRPMKRMNI